MRRGFSLLLLLLAAACAFSEVEVRIANLSGASIRNIAVEYTGGRQTADTLAHGDALEWSIRPTAESSVTLSYDGQNFRRTEDLGVYLEPGYRGDIDVTIRSGGMPGGVVDVRSQVRMY